MNELDNTKFFAFLEKMIDPISTVDGGCSVCVRGLVKRVNNILCGFDIHAHYEYDEKNSEVALVSGMRYEMDTGDDADEWPTASFH